MIGGVTRHMLPDLSGVPHLHIKKPLLWFHPNTADFKNLSQNGSRSKKFWPYLEFLLPFLVSLPQLPQRLIILLFLLSKA